MWLFFVTACASYCSGCTTNGAAKCDTDKCNARYVFDTATKTCAGKITNRPCQQFFRASQVNYNTY